MEYLFNWAGRFFDNHRLYALSSITRNISYPTNPLPQSFLNSIGYLGESVWDNQGELIPPVKLISCSGGKIVVIKGTSNFGQWMQQVFSTFQVEAEGFPGKLAAFYAAASHTLFNMLRVSLFETSPVKIIVSGHSYGGALALCLGHLVNSFAPGSLVGVSTFGSPKVGNRYFAEGLNARHYRVDNLDDPVPALPPELCFITTVSLGFCQRSEYYHHGRAFRLSPNGEVYIQEGAQSQAEMLPRPPLHYVGEGQYGFASHDIAEYCRRLRLGLGLPLNSPLKPLDNYHLGLNNIQGISWGGILS